MSIFERYNWERVKAILPNQSDLLSADLTVSPRCPSGPKGLASLLVRRSARAFLAQPLAEGLWVSLERELCALIHQDWLHVIVSVQDAEDAEPGLYAWRGVNLERYFQGRVDVGPIVQKQWWANGGGISLFLCVDWAKASQALPGSQGYQGVWLILGQVGQALVQWACENDLGSRMTPAISESKARAILQIASPTIDAAYYFRIGHAVSD